MTNNMSDVTNKNDPREVAAYWFTRLQSADVTEEERTAFDTWYQADPVHSYEYGLLERIWTLAGQVPRGSWADLTEEATPKKATTAHWLGRRQMMVGMGIACMLFAAIGLSRWSANKPDTDYIAELTTKAGERRKVTLPDGSLFELNTATRATVRYDNVQRYVHLQDGEMMLTIAADKTRPFIVEAADARLEAGTTKFNIRKDTEGLGVVVEEGELFVATGPLWGRQSEQIGAGYGTHVASGGMATMRRIDVEAVTAWTNGQLIFKDERLAVVIREMNRHLPNPIHVHNEDVANMRIAGVFNLDDVHAFVTALPAILPVRIDTDSHGHTKIMPV
jgi:transmembrane sensor